jgi:predicted small lipoprotein YifL
MRRVPPLVPGVLAVAALAGCGRSGPDLIPQSNAQALQQTADRIAAACSSEDRSEARAQVRLAEREIDALPRAVDRRLVENLQAWVDRIHSRIPVDCRAEETPAPTATATATAAETPTATPSATGTPTETATRTPTATPTETATAAPTESATPVPTTTPQANGGVSAPAEGLTG